jgi:hypothetical protein
LLTAAWAPNISGWERNRERASNWKPHRIHPRAFEKRELGVVVRRGTTAVP